jgi:hypothetical protein
MTMRKKDRTRNEVLPATKKAIEEACGGAAAPRPFSFTVRDIVEKAKRERPDQVGLRPRRVFPSAPRTTGKGA